MKKIGLLYGTSTGRTKKVAEQIKKEFGARNVDLHNIRDTKPETILKYDNIIFGTSAWGVGDMQDDWEIFIDDIELVFPDNSLTLLIPNGGETWLTNELQEIQWTASGTFDSFTLQYSINNGNDWINIDENLPGTDSTYLWSVPNNPSENCLMQVIGFFGGQSVSDICNKSFIISLTSNLSFQNGISPNRYYLFQNYPNPFNPRTTINYQLPVRSKVNLKIYDTLGKNVQTLVNNYQEAGRHSIRWQPKILSSGVFIVLLEAGNFRQVRKIVYLK